MRLGVLIGLVALLAGAAVATAAAPRPPAPPAGAALEALAQPPVRAGIGSQRIYFVMTDRYANGDAANDRAGATGTASATGYDPADPGYFHGGDLKGLTGDCTGTKTGLARLKDLGFTSVWVTPPYGQRTVQGDSAAYHGYWIRDFLNVDRHLGTNADFAAFVDCAHRLGMKVILDVVVNHTADYVLVPSSSTYTDAPYRDCAGRRFNPARFVRKAFPCLKASNLPKIPSLFGADRRAKNPAWLNNVLNYHNRGDIAFSSCSEACFEQGDFFGLDDLFTEKSNVMQGLADIYADWIRRYRIDGFRVDTARHVNSAFFSLWGPKIEAAARQAGVTDFQWFGEVFIADAVELSRFVRSRGLPNVLDFPLQDAITRFASGSTGPRGVATRFSDDDYFTKNGVAHVPPTFLGNHDMGRVAQQVRTKATGEVPPDELLRRDLLAHDLLYLLRGAPVVYYGDEVGMMGTGGDKAARQDMFPTQVSDWRTEQRLGSGPIGAGSSFDAVAHPVAERLRALGRLRDTVPALGTAASFVRVAQDSVLAVSRIDAADRREYLVVFNNSGQPATVTVPTSTPSASWSRLYGTATAGGASGADGRVSVTIPGLASGVFRADVQLPARTPSRPVLKIARDRLTDLWEVSATVGASGPVSVSFAVRRTGAKRWARLGVDDAPPYRAFLSPGSYKRKQRVYVVAIVRSLTGTTAVSPVGSFVPRPR